MLLSSTQTTYEMAHQSDDKIDKRSVSFQLQDSISNTDHKFSNISDNGEIVDVERLTNTDKSAANSSGPTFTDFFLDIMR